MLMSRSNDETGEETTMSTVIRIVREIDGHPLVASWGTIVKGLIVTQDDLKKTSRELLIRYELHGAVLEYESAHEIIYRTGNERWWFEVDLEHPVTVGNRRFYGIEIN